MQVNKALQALLACALTFGALLAPTTASAQAYPHKTVTIVVPFPPGGATDVIARITADYLGKATKQTFVVVNVAGASGSIGHEQVARAAPDGYTLIVGTASTMPGNAAYNNLKWDPIKDFTPIGLLSTESMSVIVHPSVPVKSVQELIDLAKREPGKLNMASFGNGSISHLAGELFKTMAGVDMVHVPYQGSGPALTAMIGGHVQVMFHTLSVSLPPTEAGKLRMLAITDTKRKAGLPDMPTVAESGLPGYSAITWLGLFGPANMPKDVTAFLTAEMKKMVAIPEVRERLLKIQADPADGSAEALSHALSRDLEKWRKTIRDAGIKRD
ncbi:MAG: tripartite tricarboxylate transporter substrate binding protein [Usitatibacter sp.]